MRKEFLNIVVVLTLLAGSLKSAHAYVDIEQATFWHFLVSRWGQVYVPPKSYNLAAPYILKAEKFIKSEKGKAIFSKYGPELGAHFGWRLGCNLGWEIAGAALMLKDHRSVNLLTLIQDSALTPGLLLYPFGQVIGQHIVGNYSLSVMNKYSKPIMLSRGITKALVDDKGVPVLWEKASAQRAVSRFIGLGLGTYLAWSLFDFGHNLLYSKQPVLDTFAWDKYKIIAMAGFTYGGYVGGNIGYSLSNQKILPYALETKLYKNLAGKAKAYVSATEPELLKLSRISPKRLLFKISKGVLNRDAILWTTGSHYLASPVNALFCTALAIGLPWAIKKFEESLTQNEWSEIDVKIDYAEKFKNLKSDDERIRYADALLKEFDAGLDMAIDAAADELGPEIKETLASNKRLLFDTMMVLGINSNAIVDITHKKIEDIKTREDLLAFLKDEIIPLLGFEDYKLVAEEELDKYLSEDGEDSLKAVKENLHIFADYAVPQIYAKKVAENIQYFADVPELNESANQ